MNEILPFVTTWMDPEGIYYSKRNILHKDKLPHLYAESNKQYKMKTHS